MVDSPAANREEHRCCATRRPDHRRLRRDRPRADRAAGRTADRPIITLDLNPLAPELAPARPQAVRRVDPRHATPRTDHRRVRGRPGLPPGGAALDAQRVHARRWPTRSTSRGRCNLLEFAQKEGESHGRPVVFFYPSSIAAYGLPTSTTKARAGKVEEDDFNVPTTMYGATSSTASTSAATTRGTTSSSRPSRSAGKVDFRCIRFPGLISAVTVPSGGTSRLRPGDDPRRRRRASRTPASSGRTRASRSWRCPTRVEALLRLVAAPRGEADAARSTTSGRSPRRPAEVEAIVPRAFPRREITTAVDEKRQGDRRLLAGRRGRRAPPAATGATPRGTTWSAAFGEYLIPTIKERYR